LLDWKKEKKGKFLEKGGKGTQVADVNKQSTGKGGRGVVRKKGESRQNNNTRGRREQLHHPRKKRSHRQDLLAERKK